MRFSDLLSKGYEIRKTKIWTDSQGRTHKKSVGGWYGNPFLSIGMPIIIALFIGFGFLITQPWTFPFVTIILALFLVGFFTFSIVYDYKMKHVWTEENGWITTSLPKAPDDVKRLYHGEYNGYKLIRERENNEWTYFAHNVCTGDRIEYPEKIKDEDFSVRQMNSILGWLRSQVNKRMEEDR